MKTIFIVNPKAGKKKNVDELISKIRKESLEIDADFLIYITKCEKDAEVFVKDYCLSNGPARFIACGGDGTLNEVLNGAFGCENAEIGVIPLGTGNDFCRNFESDNFKDVKAQINGKTIKCDVIRYQTDDKTRYCINMFNIGFDCNVADMKSTVTNKTFFSGPFAYLISIFVILIKKKGADLKIEIDGKEYHNGKLLLTSIANGSFCGGGLKSNPLADIKDGNININIIKNISRLNFLSKLPFYMNGTFVKLRGIEKIISSLKCKKIVITPNGEKMRLCIDGEIEDAGKTTFEVLNHAVSFVEPSNNKIY